MGTYVYPLTSDTSVLERLAGVPEGTAALYASFKDAWAACPLRLALREALAAAGEHGAAQSHEPLAQWQDALNERPTFKRYEHFLGYGFGRLDVANDVAVLASGADAQVDVEGDRHYARAGETHDRARVAEILDRMSYELPEGVFVDDVGGLYWT